MTSAVWHNTLAQIQSPNTIASSYKEKLKYEENPLKDRKLKFLRGRNKLCRSFLTLSREPQLSTHHSCIRLIPLLVADTAPLSSKADLHHAFPGRSTMHQPHICVIALWNGHCIDKKWPQKWSHDISKIFLGAHSQTLLAGAHLDMHSSINIATKLLAPWKI